MSTILTDDEIRSAITEALNLKPTGLEEITARAVEAAVLAKMAQQEPVAWIDSQGGYNYVHWATSKNWPLGTKFYTHPAPQQADRQRVPEGWRADPSAAAVELAKIVMSDCGLAVESRHDLLGRIADRINKFAAAPEAPAQEKSNG